MKAYTATDIDFLKVHVSDGIVWTLDGSSLPQSSNQRIVDFLETDAVKNVECVRVVGSHANARLITGLYDKKINDEIGRLEVVTPLVCATRAERRDPELTLYHMRNFFVAPSLGGFHEVTSVDYPAYALEAELQEMPKDAPKQLNDLMRNYLEAHPAWRPLSFIRNIDEFSCAQLLSIILDPRWYIDRCNPNRVAKLNAWLGLNPKTQSGVIKEVNNSWRNHDKCSVVLNCWYQEKMKLEIFNNLVEFDSLPWDEDNVDCPIGLAPCDFIWRVWMSHVDNATIATLRASQIFVQFLRHTWLSCIYSESIAAGNFSLFRSADFFKYVVEAASFEKHMEN